MQKFQEKCDNVLEMNEGSNGPWRLTTYDCCNAQLYAVTEEMIKPLLSTWYICRRKHMRADMNEENKL